MGTAAPRPARVPVVFVHGVRTSATMWRAQLAAVRAVGNPATAVDLPGHGARRDEPFTLDAAVATVAEAVEELGAPALVVGLSLGGYVTIAHAARHPEQVRAIVAASCSTQPNRVTIAGYRALAGLAMRGTGVDAGLDRWVIERMMSEQAADDLTAGGLAPEVMPAMLAAMAPARPVRELTTLRVPVWLVNGQFDHFRSQERRYLRSARDGRLRVIPKARHLVSLDAPVAFSRAVLEALDELEGAGPATAELRVS